MRGDAPDPVGRASARQSRHPTQTRRPGFSPAPNPNPRGHPQPGTGQRPSAPRAGASAPTSRQGPVILSQTERLAPPSQRPPRTDAGLSLCGSGRPVRSGPAMGEADKCSVKGVKSAVREITHPTIGLICRVRARTHLRMDQFNSALTSSKDVDNRLSQISHVSLGRKASRYRNSPKPLPKNAIRTCWWLGFCDLSNITKQSEKPFGNADVNNDMSSAL